MNTTPDLADIQGNLFSGYNLLHARHYALAVTDAALARRLIGEMVDDADDVPQVTRATVWEGRKHPQYALNLGFTHAGLSALGLRQSVLDRFPPAFVEGPAARAARLGDTEGSAPEHWGLGGPGTAPVHLFVSLYSDDLPTRDGISHKLSALFAARGLQEIRHLDAATLPDRSRVHFGYKDGISQPRIQGAPKKPARSDEPEDPDRPGPDGYRSPQPEAPTGDFLLGHDYKNSFEGNHLGDLPSELGNNATYGAFRWLQQDVVSFERLLRDTGRRWDLDPEWVAAKLMGRWRENGVPLSLSPYAPEPDPNDPDDPTPKVHAADLNDFDYAPAKGRLDRYDDAIGLRCPVGSHIRRLNPRNGLAVGKPHSRRIVRRGMPYGPEYRPEHEGTAQADIERGLLGWFLCADLEMQFEFIQHAWINDDLSATGLAGTREPIMGAHPASGGRFVIRTDSRKDPIIITDLPRLVTTRGSVYCLLPGIGGLRYLANLS